VSFGSFNPNFQEANARSPPFADTHEAGRFTSVVLNLFWTRLHFYLQKYLRPHQKYYMSKVFVFAPSLHCLLRDMKNKCTYSCSKVFSNSLRYAITLLNGSSALDAGYISAWFEFLFSSVLVLDYHIWWVLVDFSLARSKPATTLSPHSTKQDDGKLISFCLPKYFSEGISFRIPWQPYHSSFDLEKSFHDFILL